ncbi:MAG TPA: hypothetical protein ENI55_01195 [Alphaproteobacteria bacterium]|nr:hypothetical protein [Alphaproteobacteria bacterium]
MEAVEFILTILVALAALLTAIVVYKMVIKQKNVDLLKEQLQRKRRQGIKGGAEFTPGASGQGAVERSAPLPDGDQHFHPYG